MTLRKRVQRLEARHPRPDAVLVTAYEAVLRILPDPLLHRLGELLDLDQNGREYQAVTLASETVGDAKAPGIAAWSRAVAAMPTHGPLPAPPPVPPGAALATIRKAAELEGPERDAHLIAGVSLAVAERIAR